LIGFLRILAIQYDIKQYMSKVIIYIGIFIGITYNINKISKIMDNNNSLKKSQSYVRI